jgi:hypothetical protein
MTASAHQGHSKVHTGGGHNEFTNVVTGIYAQTVLIGDKYPEAVRSSHPPEAQIGIQSSVLERTGTDSNSVGE